MITNYKTCTGYCKEYKPVSEFYKRLNGYTSKCKRCFSIPSEKMHGPNREGFKFCLGRCGQERPISDFWRDKTRKGGLAFYCKNCSGSGLPTPSEKECGTCFRLLPIEDFKKISSSRSKTCIECATGKPKPREGYKWCLGSCGRELPIDSFYRDSRRSDGRAGRCSECIAVYSKQSIYNVSEDDYSMLLHRQGFACANPGCDTTLDQNGKALSLDHDHSCCPGKKSCGKCIRGLLCNGCNTGEGLFMSDVNRLLGMVEYLSGDLGSAIKSYTTRI